MKTFFEFFKLIRFVNLIFIAITQLIFYYCIIQPQYTIYNSIGPILSIVYLNYLILASVLIAAGGYIINDYFDLNIDRINKPHRLIIGKHISRRWAMFFHLVLSALGLGYTGYVSYHLKNPFLLLFNIVVVIVLIFYSTTFKRKLLSGNIIISLLTSWVIIILYIAELNFSSNLLLSNRPNVLLKIYKIAAVYAGFAFVVSFIREIVKDMEDQDGDRRNDCSTIPIAWGTTTTKLFVSTWIYILIGMLFILFFYSFFNSWTWLVIYIMITLLFPLFRLLKKINAAITSSDYNQLSSLIKLIMLAGILSMTLYYYYNR